MDIGVGLPSIIPGATGAEIVQWAQTAEEHDFSAVGVIDRLVYGNCDYAASGLPFSERGRLFDGMLEEMSRIWRGESRGFAGRIGPAPGVDRSQIIFGGHGARTYARVARWGAGWIAGSRGVEAFRRGAERVHEACATAGRDGTPRLMALPYFSLGPKAREDAEAFLLDHYAIEGRAASRVATAALIGPHAIREAIAAYEQAGCDELLLFPCSSSPQQVRLLADAMVGH